LFNSGAKRLTVSDILVINSPEVYCCRHDPADGIDNICNINKTVTGNNKDCCKKEDSRRNAKKVLVQTYNINNLRKEF
jgi:hypothetical protein